MNEKVGRMNEPCCKMNRPLTINIEKYKRMNEKVGRMNEPCCKMKKRMDSVRNELVLWQNKSVIL